MDNKHWSPDYKRIALLVLLPPLLTLLSLNYRQESQLQESRRPRSSYCVKFPDYDAKAGFPLPIVYDTTYARGSSPLGIHKAAAGGPFSLLGGTGEDVDCTHIDGKAFAYNLVFYAGLTLLGLAIEVNISSRRDSAK
jgi:hypothetical protein